MTLTRVLVFALIIGAAVYWWKNNHTPSVAAAQKSENGFVSAMMPDGAGENAVIIFAPVNCPSDAAKRADGLATKLTKLGIPNVRSSSYSVSLSEPTAEQNAAMKRSVAILEGEIPAVFFHGKAKANPTAEEVAAEYKLKK